VQTLGISPIIFADKIELFLFFFINFRSRSQLVADWLRFKILSRIKQDFESDKDKIKQFPLKSAAKELLLQVDLMISRRDC